MKLVPSGVTQSVARSVLHTKKASPTLMFGVGIASVITSTVLACRATRQLDEVLDQIEKDRVSLEEDRSVRFDKKGREIDPAKMQTALYVKNVLTIGKLYAPAVVVGVVGIAALTGSHRTLTNRNVALTAAYATVQRGFADYRQRVLEDVGADKEREYRYPTETVSMEDPATGKKVKVKKHLAIGESEYSKFFDDKNRNWEPNKDHNFHFLKLQQNWANDRLHSRGHVFLNEVYEALGFPHTTAGAVTGWVVGNGDDFIDFGITEDSFMGDFNLSVLVDFNVDGIVYDKI